MREKESTFNCFNARIKRIPCSRALLVMLTLVNYILITFWFICSFFLFFFSSYSSVFFINTPKFLLEFDCFCILLRRMSLMMDIPTFTRYYFQNESKCRLQTFAHTRLVRSFLRSFIRWFMHAFIRLFVRPMVQHTCRAFLQLRIPVLFRLHQKCSVYVICVRTASSIAAQRRYVSARIIDKSYRSQFAFV